MRRGSYLRNLLPVLETGARAATDEEAYVNGSFAHDDDVGIGKVATVDVDAEVAGFQPLERP